MLVLAAGCDAAVTAEADSKVAAEAPLVAEVAVAGGGEVQAQGGAEATGKVEIAADAFKLERVTALIEAGEIETAEELELAVNDPEAEINRIDVDADGEVDHVEVVEVRGDAKVDFEMRVIPSSRATVVHAVPLATASVVAARATSQISFSASFSAGVSFTGGASASTHVHSFVAPATFSASAVVVAQPLLAWVFVAERPVYHSVYIEADSGKWIPPGHLKHGHWKATGGVKGNGKLGGGVDVHASLGGKGKGKAEVGGGGKGKGGGEFGGAGKSGGHSKGNDKPAKQPEPKHSSSAPKGGKSDSGSKGGGPKGGGGKSDGGSKGGGGGGGKGKNK